MFLLSWHIGIPCRRPPTGDHRCNVVTFDSIATRRIEAQTDKSKYHSTVSIPTLMRKLSNTHMLDGINMPSLIPCESGGCLQSLIGGLLFSWEMTSAIFDKRRSTRSYRQRAGCHQMTARAEMHLCGRPHMEASQPLLSRHFQMSPSPQSTGA